MPTRWRSGAVRVARTRPACGGLGRPGPINRGSGAEPRGGGGRSPEQKKGGGGGASEAEMLAPEQLQGGRAPTSAVRSVFLVRERATANIGRNVIFRLLVTL